MESLSCFCASKTIISETNFHQRARGEALKDLCCSLLYLPEMPYISFLMKQYISCLQECPFSLSALLILFRITNYRKVPLICPLWIYTPPNLTQLTSYISFSVLKADNEIKVWKNIIQSFTFFVNFISFDIVYCR